MVDVLEYSRRIAHGENAGVDALVELNADESISAHDKREILFLALYTIEYEADRRDKQSRRHRRAMALLRSFLTSEQQSHLRSTGNFYVRGSLGNLYQLHPRTGNVWRVERRGKRWSGVARYCLHDYAEDDPTFVPMGLPGEGKRSRLPSPDTTLGHMLLLCADETEFLRRANESIWTWRGMWHAEWAARLTRERRDRIEADERVAA